MNGIHQLRPEDLVESVRLSEFAFQMTFTEQERAERAAKLKPEQLWGYYENGKLAAKLTLLPLTIHIGGKKFAMGGIGGVATWPEYRRNGYVGKLLSHSLELMRERGQTISTLAPFSFPFYRKYGYEAYVDFKQYEIETRLLPQDRDVPGRAERNRDIPLLNDIYEAYAGKYNGMLVRTAEWWENRVLSANLTSVVWYDDDGKAYGYMLYDVKNRVMSIREIVFLNEKARRGLLRFIANHDSMMDKVQLKAPVDDKLSYILTDPRIKTEMVPYFMARIVDVEAFLKLYEFMPGPVDTWVLRVEDRTAEWNNGWYQVTVDEEGKASVERSDASSEKGIDCSIQDLAAMFMGYQSPSFLHSIGRIRGEQTMINILERRIVKKTPFLSDFF